MPHPALALLGLWLFVSPALAGMHLGVGLLDEIDGQGSHALTLSGETRQAHPWEFMLGVLDARNRPASPTPRVWLASVSKRFSWKSWFVQGGIAMTNSDTEVLSRHWQFQTGAGYRHRRFTLSLRHLSNAGTGGRNRGENILLLQYAL